MHEVTETWLIDGWHHVIPSKGKNKGQTLRKFKSESEANKWAKQRSNNYQQNTKKGDSMPQGEGTYGNQVGRPAKKKKEEESSTDGKTLLTSVKKKEKEY